MNREIKFRIWDKKFKKWLTSGDGGTHCSSNWAIDPFTGKIIDYVECDGEYTPSEEPDRYFDGRVSIKESPFVKQQYTGAKDRVGIEIYEGDIVEFYPWNSPKKALEDYLCKNVKKVIWGLDYGQYPSAGWSVINLQPADLEDGHQLNYMDSRNMEVVGNIFENPELLEA
jgi:uncharacterized phage protein (TIGR01671 family)